MLYQTESFKRRYMDSCGMWDFMKDIVAPDIRQTVRHGLNFRKLQEPQDQFFFFSDSIRAYQELRGVLVSPKKVLSKFPARILSSTNEQSLDNTANTNSRFQFQKTPSPGSPPAAA